MASSDKLAVLAALPGGKGDTHPQAGKVLVGLRDLEDSLAVVRHPSRSTSPDQLAHLLDIFV